MELVQIKLCLEVNPDCLLGLQVKPPLAQRGVGMISTCWLAQCQGKALKAGYVKY